MPERRILITGGCGFIGSHLAERLTAAGAAVTVLDDLSTGLRENLDPVASAPGFEVEIGSILDGDLVDRLVRRCDAVFHLAAAVGVELIIADPVRVIETNILGSGVVLRAAARHGKKILLASTSEIYGKSEAVPFHEESDRLLGPTTRWRWSYSTSKAADEYLGLAYHRQLGLPVVIARLFNTVGPRQRGHYGMVVPRFVEQAVAGRALTVYGDGTQTRAFCDVRDVVRALAALIDHPDAEGRVFNVGSTRPITILELARTVWRTVAAHGRGASGEPRIERVPYAEAYEAGFEDMARRVPDTARIAALLGWRPEIPLERTIQDMVALDRPPTASPTAGR